MSQIIKALAFVVALSIIATGVAGIVAPGVFITIGQRSVTPVGLYVVAALRIVIGLVLLGASSASRTPRTLRVIGIVVITAGLATPLFGLERAHAIMNWLLAAAPVVLRLWAVVAITFGSFILYAVGTSKRAA